METRKRKNKKIILTVSTMAMAFVLLVIGVYAAIAQSVNISGKITTTIEDPSQNAKVEVTASIRETTNDFMQYGYKPSVAKTITFTVPDIVLDDESYYIIHKFEFNNYGAPLASFDLNIEGNAADNFAFTENFDYYIGDTVSPELKNTVYHVQDFLGSGVESQVSRDVYVLIRLKEIPIALGELVAIYNIAISYSV